MAERWSLEVGLGSGSVRKTSSGRAGPSGFSGAGKVPEAVGLRPGGTTTGGGPVRGPVGVQSADPYIRGMLQGVSPERHREALRREAQRLTDVSAHHDGEIRARRAEGYLNEDPKVQGWLRLIRGTDAELRQNGGKARPGTLNDRVQRIQAALGEPLQLTPRQGTPQPPGLPLTGGEPSTPKRYPPPEAPEGEVSVGRTGYVASMLREGPAGNQPVRRPEAQSARDLGPAKQVTANLAGQPGVPPRQQTGMFTKRSEQPAAPEVQPGRPGKRGAGAHPLVATTLDQLFGTFKGPPQIGVGVTPAPQRGVATTFDGAVKRARAIAQPSAGPAPVRVAPAPPGQAPTVNQLMQEFTGTPYGPTGERARQAHNKRLKDPAYLYAGPDTWNPATEDVHRGRTGGELWGAYALANFAPITDATLQKLNAEYSAQEKFGQAAAPPLLAGSDQPELRKQQLAQITAVIPKFKNYVNQTFMEYQRQLDEAQRVLGLMGEGSFYRQDPHSPQYRQAQARWDTLRTQGLAETVAKTSPEAVVRELERQGGKLTAIQKQAVASAADYRRFQRLTDGRLMTAVAADTVVNLLAAEFGGFAAAKLATRFPWLKSAGVKLATKLGMDEAAAVQAKAGALNTLKRGAQGVVKHARPTEHSVASGLAGGLQQPLTYALSDDHPTAGRLIQEAALGFGGGLVGERAFTGAVRGLGVPGRWLAQWAEKHPSVEKVRQVLRLIGSGDIQFREGGPEPVFSPQAQQVLGGGAKPPEATLRPATAPGGVRDGRAPGAPVLPGHEGQPHAGREQTPLAGPSLAPGSPVTGGVMGPGGVAKTPGPHPLAAGPEPAPPPKSAPSNPELATAPAQMPGAVAVSGEPDFSAAVLQGLAEARDAAAIRIAARRPRKGPALLPQSRKGMRPGVVISPSGVGDELGDLLDYALIGATHLAEGAWDRSVWDRRMVKRVGKRIEPYLEQIRELARRIHQGWKEYRIPTQGPRVQEAARTYLQKLAAEAAPAAAASRGTSPPGRTTARTSSDAFVPDRNLTREGKLPPLVEKSHQAALEQLRSGTGQWQYGLPDPQSLKLYAQAGATYLAKGFPKEAWKERMLADLGGGVEPILDWLWQYTDARYNSYYQNHLNESWNTSLDAPHAQPSGSATRPATRPETAGTPGKAAAPGGTEVRPLGRPLSSDKAEVTKWKQRMKDQNYPPEEIEAGIARYFDPVREQYADLAGKDNVFIPMPSTTGENIVPEALARRLADAFGGEVLPRRDIRPLHTAERKLLKVYERFIQPAEYEVTADLARLAGKNVVLVDDILTSGDSAEGLRYALRQQGITQTDVVTLASSSKAATATDLARLSTRVAKGMKKPESEVKKLVEAQLKHAPHKLVNELSNEARDPRHAEAIYYRLTGKRTAVPRNGG